MVTSSGAALRNAESEAGAHHHLRYSTLISACEKGQWQPALALLCEMLGVMREPILHYSTRTRACEKGQW